MLSLCFPQSVPKPKTRREGIVCKHRIISKAQATNNLFMLQSMQSFLPNLAKHLLSCGSSLWQRHMLQATMSLKSNKSDHLCRSKKNEEEYNMTLHGAVAGLRTKSRKTAFYCAGTFCIFAPIWPRVCETWRLHGRNIHRYQCRDGTNSWVAAHGNVQVSCLKWGKGAIQICGCSCVLLEAVGLQTARPALIDTFVQPRFYILQNRHNFVVAVASCKVQWSPAWALRLMLITLGGLDVISRAVLKDLLAKHLVCQIPPL